MSRRRLALLALGGLAGTWGLLRTSPPAGHARAAGVDRPPERVVQGLPTRQGAPALPPPPACCAQTADLRLELGEHVDLGDKLTLFPTYAAELAWPLPDELPRRALEDDPLLWSLQELLGAEDSEREALLDAVDQSLDADPAPSPWARLARIEAERQLEVADHATALEDHTAALEAWAAAGGRGELPPSPEPRQTGALADEARALAETLPPGPAAQLAGLTAAALLTDWDGDHHDEEAAAELLVDVLLDAEQPHVLAAAADLLVGLDVAPAPEELDLLAEIGPELGAAGRARLEWFLAEQRAAQGEDLQARHHLELARLAAAEHRGHDAESRRLVAAVEAARGPLLGRTGGAPAGWREAVLAAAQGCGDEHGPVHQDLRLALTPAGLHAFVGEGDVAGCIRAALGAVQGPEGGVDVSLKLRMAAQQW